MIFFVLAVRKICGAFHIWRGTAIKMNMMTLDKAKRGKNYQILGFTGGDSAILRRFFELGFIAGEHVKIVSTSLQKKVFLIEIRGYLLSVRTNLLSCVQVKA